jgi:hypothetical protein
MLALVPNVAGYCQENFKCGTFTKRALKGKSKEWKARDKYSEHVLNDPRIAKIRWEDNIRS